MDVLVTAIGGFGSYDFWSCDKARDFGKEHLWQLQCQENEFTAPKFGNSGFVYSALRFGVALDWEVQITNEEQRSSC